MLHRTFISYHHGNDQAYKDELLRINGKFQIFNDVSVNTREIDDNLPHQTIREKIRDEYLRESDVTILLAGTETKYRKHVDWELFSSMHDGAVNKRSGLLVINLPTTGCSKFNVAHDGEKETVYPEYTNWVAINSRAEWETRYPHMPDRIIDNLVENQKAKISVASWNTVVSSPDKLSNLINYAAVARFSCEYDLRRPMRKSNG